MTPPIRCPANAGKPYRPSNGTEGEMFSERYCERCAHDATYRRTFEAEDGCRILTSTLVYDVAEKGYPAEWVYDAAGVPTCTAFEVGT